GGCPTTSPARSSSAATCPKRSSSVTSNGAGRFVTRTRPPSTRPSARSRKRGGSRDHDGRGDLARQRGPHEVRHLRGLRHAGMGRSAGARATLPVRRVLREEADRAEHPPPRRPSSPRSHTVTDRRLIFVAGVLSGFALAVAGVLFLAGFDLNPGERE